MTEYVVKIAFWLRAFDSVTIEATSDAEAIEKAKVAATAAMESTAFPEHIDTDERREGVIAYIDRTAPDGNEPVIDDVEFDADRIHDPEHRKLLASHEAEDLQPQRVSHRLHRRARLADVLPLADEIEDVVGDFRLGGTPARAGGHGANVEAI